MAGAPPRYSDEQWAAVFRRHFDDKATIRQVHREANAGELPGCEAFPVSYDQCRDRVRLEKLEREARTPPAAGDYATISRRLWVAHVAEMERLERDLKRRKRDEKRQVELEQRLAAAIKRHKDARGLVGPIPKEGEEAGKAEETRPPTFIESVAETSDPDQPKPEQRDDTAEDATQEMAEAMKPEMVRGEASGEGSGGFGGGVKSEARLALVRVGAADQGHLHTESVGKKREEQ